MECLRDILLSICENKDAVWSFGEFAAISSVLLIIFAVSFLGCILPMLPGVFLAFCGILIWKLTIGFYSISWLSVFICAALALFAQVLDFWLPIKYTPTRQGARGALFGVVFGIVLSFAFPPLALLAIFFSPPLFAFVFERAWGDSKMAWRSGKGAFWGTLLGVFAKSAIIFVMILIALLDSFIN